MALGITIGASVSTMANAESGFLKDYAQLQTEKDPLGIERRIWISPDLTRDKYQKFLIEQGVFYPAPKPSDQVPSQSLAQIRDYLDASLRKAVGSVLPLADKPGPGVARVRVAITAASVDSGLKPYQLIPVALVFTAAKEASGKARHDVKLAVESEISDSQSGKPLARSARDPKGIELKGDEKLTFEMTKPKIDDWA